MKVYVTLKWEDGFEIKVPVDDSAFMEGGWFMGYLRSVIYELRPLPTSGGKS